MEASEHAQEERALPLDGERGRPAESSSIGLSHASTIAGRRPTRDAVQVAPETSARSPDFVFTGFVPLRVITKKIALPQDLVYFLLFYDKQAAVAPIQFIVLFRRWKKGHNGSHGWCFKARAL